MKEFFLNVVAPELPPAPGGVADYAARLAEAWPGGARVEAWVARGADTAARALPAWTVRAWDREPVLPESGVVLVHYTQYGYSARGAPSDTVDALTVWRRRGEGRRLAVFFHETWLVGPWWRRRGLISPWARRLASKLAAAADVAMTNCERHAAQLASAARAVVIPVPANIPVIAARTVAAGGEERLRVVVFGLPETRLRALRAHREFLRWLAASSSLGELVLLGAGSEADRFALAGAEIAREVAGARVRRVGPGDERMVSAELAGADLGLTAYGADELGKSGTVAALFAHGCPVGCPGHDADGLAFSLEMTGCGPADWREFREREERAARVSRAKLHAESTLSWPRHAARVAACLAGLSSTR